MGRRFVGAVCLLGLVFQAGCYRYLPLQSELPQTAEAKVILNERGQLQMADGMGPFVESVEGVLAGEDSAAVRLKVSRVMYVRGGSAMWSGESVSIPKDGILGFQGRELSKQRSWLLAGATVAVVAYSILNTSLDVFGNSGTEPCTGPHCGDNSALRP